MTIRFSSTIFSTFLLFSFLPTANALDTSGNVERRSASLLDGNSGSGSLKWEQARDVATDSQGNMIIVGGTPSPDYPTTPGAHDRSLATGGNSLGNAGAMDIFITKLSPDGELIWSTYLGGPNYDRAYAVEVDNSNNIIVAGRAGDNFPTTSGVRQRNFAGDNRTNDLYGKQDGFVAKFSANGARLWSTYFGGPGRGFIRDIDVDHNGNILIGGSDFSGSFSLITPGAYQTNARGGKDAVFARLSSDGRDVSYATYIGGSTEDGINPSVRSGQGGSAYIVFLSDSRDINTKNAFQPNRAGETDLVIAKFNSNNGLDYLSYLGGSGREDIETHNLAVNSQGQAFVAGTTLSGDFPTRNNPYQGSRPGNEDGFITKISADGRSIIASTYFGGSGRDEIEGIALDNDGGVVVTGGTHSGNFPVSSNAYQSRNAGDRDFYIAKLDNNLRSRTYGTFYGGSGRDAGRGIALSPSGDVIAVGITRSNNFPTKNEIDSNKNGLEAAAYIRLTSETSQPEPEPEPGDNIPPTIRARARRQYTTHY